MKQKEFNIYKKDGEVKIQIGESVFGLDKKEQSHVLETFNNVKRATKLFPRNLNATAVMYPNGIIAMTLSIGKLTGGRGYILIVYSLPMTSAKYKVDTFMITGDALDNYIRVLE